MAWNDSLTALNYVLAGLYPFKEESLRVVEAAGLPKIHVAFRDKAIDNWYNILVQADTRGMTPAVIDAALKDHPSDPILNQAKKGELRDLQGPRVDAEGKWKADLSGDTLERIIGKQSSLLPISFLEMGLLCARSVARVELAAGYGSGFITDNNIFVTNNHVIKDETEASTARIQFNYQQNARGLDLQATNFQLDPGSGFSTSVENDWTLVRVEGDANADWGAIKIEPVELEKTERVNIVQHPGGGPKQIALYHNIVAYVDERRIQYLTDTLPGSSGSPVFDDRWRVVALHHSGGWILEPGTRKQVYRNEGISIGLVQRAIKEAGF